MTVHEPAGSPYTLQPALPPAAHPRGAGSRTRRRPAEPGMRDPPPILDYRPRLRTVRSSALRELAKGERNPGEEEVREEEDGHEADVVVPLHRLSIPRELRHRPACDLVPAEAHESSAAPRSHLCRRGGGARIAQGSPRTCCPASWRAGSAPKCARMAGCGPCRTLASRKRPGPSCGTG